MPGSVGNKLIRIWLLCITGYFMPNLSTSPPPYEEALKHKVILSSYTTTPAPAYTPTAADPTPVPVHTQSTNRYSTGSDRDHVRPLRYYPGMYIAPVTESKKLSISSNRYFPRQASQKTYALWQNYMFILYI